VDRFGSNINRNRPTKSELGLSHYSLWQAEPYERGADKLPAKHITDDRIGDRLRATATGGVGHESPLNFVP
jgi:hypothetical protein